MGDVKVMIHIQNGMAFSDVSLSKEVKGAEIGLAIAHLELKKQHLLEILKKHSEEVKKDKSSGK